MSVRKSSLFDAGRLEPIGDAANWFSAVMQGSLAIALCVLAVAFVGLTMLSGRLEIRNGLRVILGCFVLLGAPVVAAAFLDIAEQGGSAIQPSSIAEQPAPPRTDPPPATYDPYAGASLRSE